MDRTFLLARVAQARGAQVIFENPKRTRLFDLSVAKKAALFDYSKRYTVWLGAFGSATKKPVSIWPRLQWLAQLPRAIPSDRNFLTTFDRTGLSFKANDLAKLSQIYPLPFGRAVAGLFHKNFCIFPRKFLSDAWLSDVAPSNVRLSAKQRLQLREAAMVSPGVDELRELWCVPRLGVPLASCFSGLIARKLKKLNPVAHSIKPLSAPPWTIVCIAHGDIYVKRGRHWCRLLVQKESRGNKRSYSFVYNGKGANRRAKLVVLGSAVLVDTPSELQDPPAYHVKKRPCTSTYRSQLLC